jgi:hypothetical protein
VIWTKGGFQSRRKISSTTIKGIMDTIINLIVYLIVFGLIWWAVGMLPLPAPVAQIVRILFIILLIFIILSAAGILPGGYLPRVHL